MSREIINNYIERGFNVIPVKSDKKPAIKSWVNFQKEKIDVQKFDELLMEAKRHGNEVQGIAVITGEISGVTVIDFDNGSEDILFGTNTPTVRTGSGGKHYYFKYTDKISQSANRELKIDVRNDGGYALMPPSITDKGKYEWVRDLSTPLLDLPQSFIEHYQKNYDAEGRPRKNWAYSGVGEGERNSRAVSVVGDLINKFKHKPDVAWELFKGWNTNNQPPLEQAELENIFKWCLDKDAKNEQTIILNQKELYQLDLEQLMNIEQREMLTTGIPEIDVSFKHPTGYYVICANPGVGKGWWALWLSRKFWQRHQKRSVYFSLEMTTDLIKKRILQQWSVLTENDFNLVVAEKQYDKIKPAFEMLKQDMFRVDEFGGSDTSQIKPEVFRKKIETYYKLGFRIFHFDHLHEIDGANNNETNQKVTETWAKCFQNICKDFPDIWLFVFAQPKSEAAKKQYLERTDILGSKAITQKCEFFYSLNRKVNLDKEDSFAGVNDERIVTVFLDKNRITSAQYTGYKLQFSMTGNFLGYLQVNEYIGMFKEE